jgi:hypothetical protein
MHRAGSPATAGGCRWHRQRRDGHRQPAMTRLDRRTCHAALVHRRGAARGTEGSNPSPSSAESCANPVLPAIAANLFEPEDIG